MYLELENDNNDERTSSRKFWTMFSITPLTLILTVLTFQVEKLSRLDQTSIACDFECMIPQSLFAVILFTVYLGQLANSAFNKKMYVLLILCLLQVQVIAFGFYALESGTIWHWSNRDTSDCGIDLVVSRFFHGIFGGCMGYLLFKKSTQ